MSPCLMGCMRRLAACWSSGGVLVFLVRRSSSISRRISEHAISRPQAFVYLEEDLL